METERKKSNIFVYISIILLVGVLILGYQTLHLKKQLNKQVTKTEEVTTEKDELLDKLVKLEQEYETLGNEYEGLDSLFTAEKERVQKLQKEIRGLKGSVRNYKGQVADMETRLQDYLAQIEELKLKNEELTTENIKIKTELDSAMVKNKELATRNTDLAKMIETGSLLVAYDIIGEGIKVRSNAQEIPTTRARRAEKIRICFTIGENVIAQKGNRTVYIRIAEPNGDILYTQSNDLFEFDGEKIAYSGKQGIQYDNTPQDICVYWTKTKDLKKGTYYADIFLDSYQLGTTTFALK